MGRAKLDARGRQLLSTLRDADSAPADVSVFVQGHAEFEDAQLETLRRAGAEVRAVAGDVLTATAPIDRLEALSGYDFVKRIEVSAPLYSDHEAGPRTLGDI